MARSKITRQSLDPKRFGVKMTREKFIKTVGRMFKQWDQKRHPESRFRTVDNLLIHPMHALEFCEFFRDETHFNLIEPFILRALMSWRKNGKKAKAA